MNKRGFTLIELMIVVVIIGILASIAIPKFSLASWKAKEKEADVLLKQVYEVQTVYYAQYGSYTPDGISLELVGFSIPNRMEYYSIPAPNGYSLPLCLQASGAWANRQIDTDGVISDC